MARVRIGFLFFVPLSPFPSERVNHVEVVQELCRRRPGQGL